MNKLLLAALCVGYIGQASAGRILITEFNIASVGYGQMQASLEADGHIVDIVDATTDGNISAALAGTMYDQVFLWDLTSTSFLSAGDAVALADFWDDHSGLVVDTRSYGYHFQGTDPSEIALIQNVAANLDLSGGGVWVGSDHAPEWAFNANIFLNAIGVAEITGIFSDPVNFNDPASVLLDGVTTVDLWGGGQSVGRAPLGMQDNGIEMFLHFGHIFDDGSINPYISASFDLPGPDPDPDPVPEPGTLALFGLSIMAMSLIRRRLLSLK
jgi:hypothetical protein